MKHREENLSVNRSVLDAKVASFPFVFSYGASNRSRLES